MPEVLKIKSWKFGNRYVIQTQNQKKAGVNALISEKINFNAGNREGYT